MVSFNDSNLCTLWTLLVYVIYTTNHVDWILVEIWWNPLPKKLRLLLLHASLNSGTSEKNSLQHPHYVRRLPF